MHRQDLPRLLTVMGSGETTPTMVRAHRRTFEQLGPGPVPAVLLDTPYGFQSNASDISARAVAYFSESVGRDVRVASLRRAEGEAAGSLAVEAALAQVAESSWLFAGPGSPTYALRQWKATVMPKLLAEKLAGGGSITFASAAALTLGAWTVPVYEVYKAGEDPVWAQGLDLLAAIGLRVAVIPHYDNAEGGNHDTRFCYLGEQRLAAMEASLPEDAWVLGVDEHTALVMDLDEGTAMVAGLGKVTLRHRGASRALASGETVAIDGLAEMAMGARAGAALRGGPGGGERDDNASGGAGPCSPRAEGPADGWGDGASPAAGTPGAGAPGASPGGGAPDSVRSPLLADAARLSEAFDKALAAREAEAATGAVLDMEALVHSWASDTFESDELDRARATLRRMVVRLGEAAGPGLRDPRTVVAPWVDALLGERGSARRDKRFADADRIRDVLVATGVEVRDTPEGTEWSLRAGT